jgi:hypothetical protein
VSAASTSATGACAAPAGAAPRAARSRHGAETYAEIRRLHEAGLSMSRIGEILGLNKNQVVGCVHRMGLQQRGLPPALAGRRVTVDAVPPQDRARIAELWFSGLSAKSVAARMGEGWSSQRIAYLAKLWALPRNPLAMAPRASCHLASRLVTRAPRQSVPSGPPPPIPRDLRVGGCRWPLWGLQERATHLYCGEPISPGCARPWCEKHRAIGTAREVA